MELKLAQRICEAIAECGEDATLNLAYSGRGMEGRTTNGVICDDFTIIIQAIINCADSFIEDEMPEFSVNNLRADSLGKRVIIY